MAMFRQLTGSPSRYGSPATRVWPCSIEPLVVRGRAPLPGRPISPNSRASPRSTTSRQPGLRRDGVRLAPSEPLPPGDSCRMFRPCGRMSRTAGASNRNHGLARPERPAVGKRGGQGSAAGNQGEIHACVEAPPAPVRPVGQVSRPQPNSARSGCHRVSAVRTGPSLRSSASGRDERSVGLTSSIDP